MCRLSVWLSMDLLLQSLLGLEQESDMDTHQEQGIVGCSVGQYMLVGGLKMNGNFSSLAGAEEVPFRWSSDLV